MSTVFATFHNVGKQLDDDDEVNKIDKGIDTL